MVHCGQEARLGAEMFMVMMGIDRHGQNREMEVRDCRGALHVGYVVERRQGGGVLGFRVLGF